MKILLLAATIFLATFSAIATGKDPGNAFYKRDIASFYAKSSTAAHIKITGFKLIKVLRPLDAKTGKPTDNFGYRTYKIRFEIIQSFKGKLRSTSQITMTIESPGKPPLGEFIALLNKDKSGSFYFTDDSLMMIPARAELISFTKTLK